MFGRILTVVILAAMIALTLLMQSTTPSSVGPVGLLAVFFLLYIIFTGVLTWVVYWLNLIARYMAHSVMMKKTTVEPTLIRSYYFASVVALAPVMILAMRSVSSVGLYELLLVIIFVVIGIFYVKKRLQ